MTSTSRSLPKSFSSFLLTATMLTVALLAFEPVAFGQAGGPGGDTVSKDLSLDLGKDVWMSSYDAIEFCRTLSKKIGMTVSLPQPVARAGPCSARERGAWV